MDMHESSKLSVTDTISDESTHRRSAANVNSPVINVINAGREFRQNGETVVAISDVSLEVSEGEIISLIGPSGCGKSTLLMMIAGLDHPTSGVVSTFGEKVARTRPEVGMIFQKDLLFDWRSIIDNVLLPFSMRGERTEPYRKRAQALLDRVGLRGSEKHRPYQLSGGMRQRVALCRGLIQDPQLILLDEPFAALDALTKEQMQLDLQALWAGERKTAVIVTHDIAEAVFLSDRVIVMSARPSRIRADIRIDLPRPRNAQTRESKTFAEYHSQIHGLFKKLGVFHD